MKTLTVGDIEHAAESLCRSERGRTELAAVMELLDAVGADHANEVITLISGEFGHFAGYTYAVIRAKVEDAR